MMAVHDIEDLSALTINAHESSSIHSEREVKINLSQTDNSADIIRQNEVGHVPGVGKIFLETFGCAHNVSDGEYMKGILAEHGYTLISNRSNKAEANLWVINSCTVKDPSQASFMRLVKEAQSSGIKLVVTGCVPQADRKLKGLEDVSMVGVTQIDKILSVVENTLQGNTVKLLSKKSELPSLDLPKIRKSPLIEIIPISTGCLGSCTYCKTKHARGKLGSYTIDALTSRVKTVLLENVNEIWLASEDTGAYGIDLGVSISHLLRSLTMTLQSSARERQMLRLGMTNPPYILAHLDVVADFLNQENVFAFIHLPVQSGSNLVLKNMRREYTVEEFSRICDYLKKYVPGITIATDIICGFPYESNEDFEETIALVEKYKFPVLNISKFYARPGTPAAKYPKVSSHIVKERSRRLTKLFESYKCYDNLVGCSRKVWFSDEVTTQSQNVGHTKEYVKVVVPFQSELIGTLQVVKIVSSSKFHVTGEVV